MNKILILPRLAVLFCFCAFRLNAQDLVILHTNDMHSQMEAFTSGRNAGTGGMLALSGYIRQVREENDHVLYLDAGDYNQGTPYFNLFGGMMEVELLNAMGLNATTLGNHEFDNGMEDLVKRLSRAKYQTLCANYDIHYRPLKRLVKPYAIFKAGDIKIGVIGLTLDLTGYTSGTVLEKLTYHDPVEVAEELAIKLKKKGCRVIICLTHLGLETDRVLAENSRNIDLIIGGHSHTFLENAEHCLNLEGKDVTIVQTGANTVYTGRIDINF